MAGKQYITTGYALGPSPLPYLAPAPIPSKRAPNVSDKAQIGQLWINTVTNNAYLLVGIANNQANWALLEAGGGAGAFASITATTGPNILTGTTSINTTGAAATTIGTGGTGAVNIGNATGNTSVTGSLSTTTTITAGTGLTVTAGNVTLTNGNLVLSAAATQLRLPGPVYVMTGAGAPAAGLALHIGDLYINTAAASATTRLYIATAVGAWTNVTTAA